MKGVTFRILLLIGLGFYSCKSVKTAQSPETAPNQPSDEVIAAEPEPEQQEELELTESDSLELAQIDTLEVIPEPIETPKRDSISIIGVGDIMMGTNFPGPEYLPPDSGKYLLKEVEDILQSADVTFGNLEGVLLNDGGEPKNCNNPKACYLFRSPLYMAQHLANAGFDLLSVANNHAGDFGDTGRNSTSQCLDSLGIKHAGFVSRPFVVYEMEELTIGFTAFSPNAGTVSIHDLDNAKKIVTHLDSISDIVIVSVHSGAEGAAFQHVTREDEIFYGENRGNIYEFAHNVVDWGADVVFGHGPHVSRGVELYNDRFIAYSLGNFCTYARFNLRGPNGFAPIVKIIVDAEGNFVTGNIFPVKQIDLGNPIIDKDQNVITLIRELSKKDFPESPLSIGDSGNILYIQNQ